jgi:hypothetical protein
MKIYISGKITGNEEEAFKLFEMAEINLKLAGFDVVNPMKLEHNHDKSWEAYMRVCIIALMSCDAIFMLTNYYESKGAIIELKLASEIAIKVFWEEYYLASL